MMKNCLVHHMTSVNNIQRLSIWKLKNYIQDKFAWSKLTEKQEKQTYNIYFIIDFIKFASLVILKPPAAKKLIFFLFLCVLVVLLKGQVCDVVIELLLFREFYTISFGLWSLEQILLTLLELHFTKHGLKWDCSRSIKSLFPLQIVSLFENKQNTW